MKKKLYISSGIIISFILLLSLPSIIAELDKRSLSKNHKIESMNFTLESEAKDIPLISRIYKINDFMSNANKPISNDNEPVSSEIILEASEEEKIVILNEVDELIDKEILVRNEDVNIRNDVDKVYAKVISSGIISNLKEYIINMKNQDIRLWWDLESEKILFIEIRGKGFLKLNPNKEKALIGFLSYLNLDLLEGWTIQGNLAESSKVNLSINIESIEEVTEYLSVKVK